MIPAPKVHCFAIVAHLLQSPQSAQIDTIKQDPSSGTTLTFPKKSKRNDSIVEPLLQFLQFAQISMIMEGLSIVTIPTSLALVMLCFSIVEPLPQLLQLVHTSMIEGGPVTPMIRMICPRIVLFSPTVEGVCRYVKLVRMELNIGSIRIKFHLKMPEIGTVALTLAHVTGRKNNFTHEAYRLAPAILMDTVECTGHIIHPASTAGITSLLVTDECSSHGTHHWCAIDVCAHEPA